MVNSLILPFTYVFLASSHGVYEKLDHVTLVLDSGRQEFLFFYGFSVGHQDHTFFFVEMFWA